MPIVESLSSKAAVKQYTDQDIPATGFFGVSPNWIAKEAALTAGTTSISITFSAPQVDLSYSIFAIMENLVDANPQIQQVEVTNKLTTGFSIQWNMPLDTSHYVLSYLIPPKEVLTSETAIGSAVTSLVDTNPLFQNGTSYPIIAVNQNVTDANPQFQTMVVTVKSASTSTIVWNAPTGTANYVANVMLGGIVQQTVNSGVNSAVITLPVSYGSTANYAMIVGWSNTSDPTPKFQPMIVTAKNPNNFTVLWSDNTDTANYQLTAYAISLTT